MMKRKTTAYKFAKIFLVICVLSMLSIAVWAQETTLTANVPSIHTLRIELKGNGKIVVDGIPYEQSADIQIKRYRTPGISVIPDNGWKLKLVLLNGQDITAEFQGGTFVFSEMRNDVQLTVVLETQSSTPQTGDQSKIEILYLLMFLSVVGMILCVMVYQKTRTNNT